MLTLIRRITFSKVGVVITMAILVLIAISFGIGGNFTGMGGGLTGDSVATVGKEDITVSELRRRTDVELQNIRQQQPTVDVVQFVNSGGVENTLEGIINSTALAQFANLQGMVASKQLVESTTKIPTKFRGE